MHSLRLRYGLKVSWGPLRSRVSVVELNDTCVTQMHRYMTQNNNGFKVSLGLRGVTVI